MYKVQMKDGRIEDFDRNKIVNGVINAGCTPEEAEKVALEIENWLPTVAVDNVVKSADLRTKGLEVLGMVNQSAASTFVSYQKQTEPLTVSEPSSVSGEPTTMSMPEIPETEESEEPEELEEPEESEEAVGQ